MTRFRSLVLALAGAALLGGAPGASAQEPAYVPEAAAPASGLPAGVPRSMRAYTHVFIAFGVAWVLLFGYTVSVGRRFRRLEEQLDALENARG